MTMAMMQLATMGMSIIAGVDGYGDDGDVGHADHCEVSGRSNP